MKVQSTVARPTGRLLECAAWCRAVPHVVPSHSDSPHGDDVLPRRLLVHSLDPPVLGLLGPSQPPITDRSQQIEVHPTYMYTHILYETHIHRRGGVLDMACMGDRLLWQEPILPRFGDLFPSHLGCSQDAALSSRLPWEMSTEPPATHELLQLRNGRDGIPKWSHPVPKLHLGPAFDPPSGPRTKVQPALLAENAENAAPKEAPSHICNQLGEPWKGKRKLFEMELAQSGQDIFVPAHQETSIYRSLELGLEQAYSGHAKEEKAVAPNEVDFCNADFKIFAQSNFSACRPVCGSKCDCTLCRSIGRAVLLANNPRIAVEPPAT